MFVPLPAAALPSLPRRLFSLYTFFDRSPRLALAPIAAPASLESISSRQVLGRSRVSRDGKVGRLEVIERAIRAPVLVL